MGDTYIEAMKWRTMISGSLIPRYLLRAMIGPFLFSFFCLTFLFTLHFIMRYIDELVGKGLSAWVILELITLNLAWMVVLAVPMSILVATLMAFGELSQTNEVTAMKAGGMSNLMLLRPVFLAAAVVAIALVMFNNKILPEANHEAKVLTLDIRKKRPTLNITAGYFSQDIPGYSILVRKTFEQNNNLEGVTLYDYTRPNVTNVITARHGAVSFSADFTNLLFDLQEGEIHQLTLNDMESYRMIRFETHRIAMPVEGFDFARSRAEGFSRSDRELGAGPMRAIVDSLRTIQEAKRQKIRTIVRLDIEDRLAGKADSASKGLVPLPVRVPRNPLDRTRALSSTVQNELAQLAFLDKQINQYLVEIHKKYSIPAACLAFVLVGLPLGIMVRKGGFGMAATLSLGFFVLYWASLIGGEKLADRGILSPLWGMWSANLIIGAFGVYLLTKATRRQSVALNLNIARIIPARWRITQPGEDDTPS